MDDYAEENRQMKRTSKQLTQALDHAKKEMRRHSAVHARNVVVRHSQTMSHTKSSSPIPTTMMSNSPVVVDQQRRC